MTPQHVTSLELSQRLKELGVKQESMFYWVKGEKEYGYEGEWEIIESDKYFIFDHIVGYKPKESDFTVDAGEIPEVGQDELFDKWWKKEKRLKRARAKEVWSAYLSSELGEMLPSLVLDNYDCPLYQYTAHYNDEWEIWYATSFKRAEQKDVKNFYAKTECDARAKMLIHLIENNLMTLEKGGEV